MESTGLDSDNNDIIEFGAVFDDLNDMKLIEELPRFHCYFLPPDGDSYTGQPYALSMHPTIFRRIAEREEPYTYVHPRKFGFMFRKWLVDTCKYVEEHDRVTINVAGKNFGVCDYQFITKKTDLDKHVKIRHKMIDPASYFLEEGDESLPGLGLCKGRLISRTGAKLPTEVDHTAVEDALDVVSLVRYALAKVGRKQKYLLER